MTIRNLCFAWALVGVACFQQVRSGETLPESVRVYNEGVRWGRFSAAAGRVPPSERADFVDKREEIADDLRLTDYEVSSITSLPDGKAKVRIKYTWYLDSVGTVHETWSDQAWTHQGKVWILVSEVRARGESMPGLQDSVEREPVPEVPDVETEKVPEATARVAN